MPTTVKSEQQTKSKQSRATEDKPFEMPRPDRGQMVMFYPNCQTTQGNRLLGYVMRITRSNVELNVSGRLYEGVRHRDDPVLKTNQHARAFGCWEFTERDKKLDALEERLSKLESLLK